MTICLRTKRALFRIIFWRYCNEPNSSIRYQRVSRKKSEDQEPVSSSSILPSFLNIFRHFRYTSIPDVFTPLFNKMFKYSWIWYLKSEFFQLSFKLQLICGLIWEKAKMINILRFTVSRQITKTSDYRPARFLDNDTDLEIDKDKEGAKADPVPST